MSHLQPASVGPDIPVGQHVHKLDQARHHSVQAVSCKTRPSVFTGENLGILVALFSIRGSDSSHRSHMKRSRYAHVTPFYMPSCTSQAIVDALICPGWLCIYLRIKWGGAFDRYTTTLSFNQLMISALLCLFLCIWWNGFDIGASKKFYNKMKYMTENADMRVNHIDYWGQEKKNFIKWYIIFNLTKEKKVLTFWSR